ncbi:MAG: redox-regulated ATPase YchF [Thermoleophilia bacterium]
MEARIIGLKGCGKSTLMAALSRGRAEGVVTTVRMGDDRVRKLAEIFKPKKTTFAEFKVREAVWPEATGRKGEMERYLAQIAGAQVFLHVVRGFANPLLAEPPDPVRDLRELDHEFLLADLLAVERAFERAKKQPLTEIGRHVLTRAREALEAETPLRLVDFPEEEQAFLKNYQLLTQAPQVVLVNTESGDEPREIPAGVAQGRRSLAFPFAEAAEVAELSPEEQLEFAEALGLPGPAAEIVTHAAFAEMGLISFLTAGEDEVRAWPIRRGQTARQAAGAVHSDIERGFIRAEIVSYDDFLAHGSLKACRDAGVLRIEGKDYVMADGDIANFRFNV